MQERRAFAALAKRPGGRSRLTRAEPEPEAGDAKPDQGHKRIGLVLVVAALVIVADQLTKWWATEALADGPVDLFGSVRLALTTNTAGAFGLGGRFVPFLAVAALVLVTVLATRSDAIRAPSVAVAAGLVLGGALGNLLDRLFRSPGMLRGAVIDFVDLGFWPVFNLADSAITVGCILLLFWSLRPGQA